MTRKIWIILGIIAIALGLAGVVATSGAARAGVDPEHVNPRITTTSDRGFGGDSGWISYNYTDGSNVHFASSGDLNLDFQIKNSGSYWVHPAGYDTICMTESTTQSDVVKWESCVGSIVTQQEWLNPEDVNHAYWRELVSLRNGQTIIDPADSQNTYNAGLCGNTCGTWGNNSNTLDQYP